MDIILIRHAQPAWVHEGRAVNNPGLTPLGVIQAERLAAGAGSWLSPGAELKVSTMTRARETAAPLSETTGLPVGAESWLEEIRPPEHWHGQPVEYVEEVFSTASRRAPEAWWDGFEGGESFRAFHTRVTDGFLSVARELGLTRSTLHPQLWDLPEDGPSQLIVVAHGGTNAVLLGLLLGLETVPWEWERFFLSHASITRLGSTSIGLSHTFSLRSFSDCSHLDAGQITA